MTINRRTVHSLVKLLALFPGIRLIYVCPEILTMPEEIIDEVNQISINNFGIPMEQIVVSSIDLRSVIKETDVLYATRIQKERFPSQVYLLLFF